MARLKRSPDGHLYILGGQRQGTWQVSNTGEDWLQSKRHPIPDSGQSVPLNRGTFRFLKDHGYIYTLGIAYERHEPSAQAQNPQELLASGPPIRLQVDLRRQSWKLEPDLTALAAGPMPGLVTGWQGNVFVEDTRWSSIWRRCLTGSTISFSGEIYWLAEVGQQPEEWPGNYQPIGCEQSGWQLWHLEGREEALISNEKPYNWFCWRGLELKLQRHHLEVVSPLSALTDDGWHIVSANEPLIIRCKSARRQRGRARHRLSLSIKLLDSSDSDHAPPPQMTIEADSTAQAAYFRWPSLPPGAYRFQLAGNASADPLLIRADAHPEDLPQWPPMFRCMVISTGMQQSSPAFDDTPDVVQHEQMPITGTSVDLPALTWLLEPAGLPVRVTWEFRSPQGMLHTDTLVFPVFSGAELTEHWQKRIWPAIAAAAQAKLTLDAGSFGRIELPVMPSPPLRTAVVWEEDKQLRSQFIWLSQLASASDAQARATLPAPLRSALRQLQEEVSRDAFLQPALARLTASDRMPSWALARLQVLIRLMTEVRGRARHTPPGNGTATYH